MNKLIALAVGALALGTIRSAHAAPAWCKDAHFDRDLDLKDLADSDPQKVIIAFAHAACAPTPEVDAHKAEIEQNRAAWGKRLGMVEADWGDVIAFVAENQGSARSRVSYSTKDLTQFTPVDQYKAIAEGFQVTVDGNASEYRAPRYVADVFDTHLTEVGRYAYISGCMNERGGATGNQPPGAAWAVCQGDIEKFDLAKFYDQLRGDTAHGGDFKQTLRFQVFDITARLKAHAAHVQDAYKKDPVYKRMFDVTTKARAEWTSTVGTNTKLVELALQLDSAVLSSSRKQFEGCEDKTAEALRAEVAKLPAAQFKGMHDIRFDPYAGFAKGAGPLLVQIPSVNLAAMPYILCQRHAGSADFLASYMDDLIGFRGPRSAALSRLYGEKFVLDDMNERIDWPGNATPLWGRSGGTLGSAGGVVASTKVDGDLVIVKLAPYMVKRDECTKSHKTNRISQVLINGDVVYETICESSKTVSENEQWADFKINKKYAALLKPGVKFSAVSPNGNDKLGMDVIAMWPNKAAETPTWLLGAVIK